MLRDGANDVAGTAAIIRDVTTRWRQKALKERIAVLEAKVASLEKAANDRSELRLQVHTKERYRQVVVCIKTSFISEKPRYVRAI